MEFKVTVLLLRFAAKHSGRIYRRVNFETLLSTTRKQLITEPNDVRLLSHLDELQLNKNIEIYKNYSKNATLFNKYLQFNLAEKIT